MLILCAYTFCENFYLKKILKTRSSLTWRQSKKCKICIRISKTNIRLQLLWEAAMQECFQNKFVLKSSHQDIFFNIAVLQLWWNSLKNSCDGMQFLVNFHVTLSSFEPLLRKSYISSQHKFILNSNSYRAPLENCFRV